MPKFRIGIDGTDSIKGGCTTWTMSRVIDDLLQNFPDDIQFFDYPYLVRLNPNIPFKTRGNGALSISFESTISLEKLSRIIVRRVKSDYQSYQYKNEKDPCVVIFVDQKPDPSIYNRALVDFLDWETISEMSVPDFIWPNANHSQVGATAASAFQIEDDYTFELLVYRQSSFFGNKRSLHAKNIKELSQKYKSTFSSFDHDQHRELIAPSGPDPVYYGIRGTNPSELLEFSKNIILKEKPSSATIFKTNQGTNVHVSQPNNSHEPFSVFSGLMEVISRPEEFAGGHLRFLGSNDNYFQPIMVFEPTKHLRDVTRKLNPGDLLYLHGAVIEDVHGISIHTEYFFIVESALKFEIRAPICDCGVRMTSSGFLKGYKCNECGTRSLKAEKLKIPRDLFAGQKVYSSLSAQRHLTRPLKRLHKRNRRKTGQITAKQFRFHSEDLS